MAVRAPTWPASSRRLAAQAEALARALAPDVATGPFYVVLRPDLPPEYQGGDGGALALTSRHLDLMLRPTLERQRRWRGRGPTILLDPVAISVDAANRPRSSRRRAFPAVAAGIELHELAHIVDAGPRDDEAEPDPGLIQFGRLTLAADLTGAETPTNGPGAAVPWRGHEWPFIRIALHLAHRAAALARSPRLADEPAEPTTATSLTANDIFDASAYELSPTRQYVVALGDEPERFAGRSITTIHTLPPPVAFVELWEADVRAWLSQREITDELSMTLAACGRRIPNLKAARHATANTKGMDAHVEGTAERIGIPAEGS